MSEKLKSILVEAVKAKLRGRALVCGICGGTRWQIVGISNVPINQILSTSIMIGGPHIPMAITSCEACGNSISFNIIAILGSIEKYNELLQDCTADSIIEKALKKD